MDVNQLIDAFGGNAAVSEIGGVGSSAVSNWRKSGCIPPRLFIRFAAAGREAGIDVPVDLFREMRTERAA